LEGGRGKGKGGEREEEVGEGKGWESGREKGGNGREGPPTAFGQIEPCW